MTSKNTFRPRTSRARRDRVVGAAETLKGGEVSGLHEALGLFVRWLDVLNEDVDNCPHCDEELRKYGPEELNHRELPRGKWWCPACSELVTVWDYLGVEDRERATFPGFREELELAFKCRHDSHNRDNGGTDTVDSRDVGGFRPEVRPTKQRHPWE